MAIDVFEVFDRRSDGAHTPPPGPRFQAARTIFAVTVAVAVLLGMCFGAFALFRGITKTEAKVQVCTPAQLADQATQGSWLRDRTSQATGTTDAHVSLTGCSKSTAGLPVGALTYLVDDEDLSGAVGTLSENGCAMKLAADKSGTCTTAIGDLPVTVKIAKATSPDATGDYAWTVSVVAPGA